MEEQMEMLQKESQWKEKNLEEMAGALQNNKSMYESSKSIYVDCLIKYLWQLEEKTRREKRHYLNEKTIKLGIIKAQRHGGQFIDVF